MDNNLHQDLLKRGYAIVPGVLDSAQIKTLRNVCGLELEKARNDTIFGTSFLGVPELAAIPFSPPVLSALKGALGGGFTIVPEFSIQAGRSGAWHFDCGAIRDAAWLLDTDYLQVQCAIYLQDPHPVYAGGLGVIPGSHRLPFSAWGQGSLPARVFRHLSIRFGRKKILDAHAGDLIIFDFRLLHRGLPSAVAEVPEAFRKFAIFFGATATEKHARFYMQSMKERAERGDPIYQDCASLRFPESYPDDVVQKCRGASIAVASL